MKNEIYEAGYNAFVIGSAESDCPYSFLSTNWEDWQEGFADARAEQHKE